jgi:hypothetical protein
MRTTSLWYWCFHAWIHTPCVCILACLSSATNSCFVAWWISEGNDDKLSKNLDCVKDHMYVNLWERSPRLLVYHEWIYYLVLTFLIFALAQTIRLLKIDSACGKTKGGRYDNLLYTVPTKAGPYAAHVLDWPTVSCDKRVNTFVHIQTISDPARLLDWNVLSDHYGSIPQSCGNHHGPSSSRNNMICPINSPGQAILGYLLKAKNWCLLMYYLLIFKLRYSKYNYLL